MPNRMLRDWTDSEKIHQLDWHEEVLFIRLIMKADDFGRFCADPRLVSSLCFPFGKKDFGEAEVLNALNALEKAQLIMMYKVGGKPILEILNYGQRLRQKRGKWPDKNGNDMQEIDAPLPTVDNAQPIVSVLPPIAARREEEGEVQNEEKVETKKGDIYPSPSRLPNQPTIEQVVAAAAKRGLDEDQAQYFWHHYEAVGWMTGKGPIVNWKAKLRLWDPNKYPKGGRLRY